MSQRECYTELEFVSYLKDLVARVGSIERFCEDYGIVDVEYIHGVVGGSLVPLGSLGRKLGFEKHTMFVRMGE